MSDGVMPWDSTISGSATPRLLITNTAGLVCDDQGSYACTFTNACGSVTSAPWTVLVPGCCYPNCDFSTSIPALNVADFTCFLQKYAGDDNYANCDQSTSTPVLNVADFTCLLQKFAQGCP